MKNNFVLVTCLTVLSSNAYADQSIKSFQCSYGDLKEGLVIQSEKELEKFTSSPGSTCEAPKIEWKKQYVYLYHTSCPSLTDRFLLKSFKNGKLTVIHERKEDQSTKNPDVYCNRLSVCGQNALGVVLKRGQKVKSVVTEKKMVPCEG